ncbi:MAG: DNA recombination protein RmuC [Candidatus Omnitrophica bacterium]|nr:DNA recombination protein RmuC [Candidatus Omnitrophota bacterium]
MTTALLAGLIGLILGAFAGYLFCQRRFRHLTHEFKSLASDALKNANELFLSTAIKDLRQVRTEAEQSVDTHKQAIVHSVSEMKSKLDDTQRIVRKFEEERFALYGKLDKSLEQVLNAGQSIQREAASIKNALTTSSGIRGKWGERVLQEILEQNDFVRGIDFDTQVTINGIDSDSRPDFVIRLPGGKRLIVDSKEVAGEYLQAQETDDPAIQKEHYEKLVSNIRDNFIKLGRKEYQSLLDPEVPFVIMFIPSEAAIRAAFATNPSIFQEANTRRVILASPMTILPLVYLIRHGWQRERLAQNARELSTVVEELGNRLFKFMEHMQSVGSSIQKAKDSWNSAIGSWETRVTPQMEKTKSLGGQFKDIPAPIPIEGEIRKIGNTKKNVISNEVRNPE